jgi:hypothetical protein
MTEFENRIRAMTVPGEGIYPRPWMTDTDPDHADVLIVGASSAKAFHVSDIGSHDQFLDSLWNRNGQTCRAMYDAATTKPSRTRPNLDRLSGMLATQGLTSLQTNVTCASAPYDAQVRREARVHGTELFKVVVAHVPWKAMIVYGIGASERFGLAFRMTMPPVPSPDSEPVWTTMNGRAIFVSPTLAFPQYKRSVWLYLERVVATVASGQDGRGMPVTRTYRSTIEPPLQSSREDAISHDGLPTPEKFNATTVNLLVWRRMQEISRRSGLKFGPSTTQASLFGAPEFSNTDRVFRHEFTSPKADILLRKDVFSFDTELQNAGDWKPYKTAFQTLRTDDPQLLDRILNAVGSFATARAP